MIRVLISPGIGNQFYQLAAAAEAAAGKVGDVEVVMAMRYLRRKHKGVCAHELPFMRPLRVRAATAVESMIYFLWQRAPRSFATRVLFRWFGVRHEQPVARPSHGTTSPARYLCGYWQDLSAAALERGLRALIDVTKAPQACVSAHEQYAALHVRAGDYVNNRRYRSLGLPYYAAAVGLLGRGRSWRIVTDDASDPRVLQIRETLSLSGVTARIACSANPLDDFGQLLGGEALVCANSTFSVLAAHVRQILGCAAQGSVVVPSDWYADPAEPHPDYRSDWHLLGADGRTAS